MSTPEAWGQPRTRTTEWYDPVAAAAAGLQLPGIEYLRRLAAGKLPPPPIAATLGFDVESVEEGSVTFAAEPGEHVYNPLGLVHGGFACTLLDSVAGCAAHTLLPAGTGYTSIEIKVSYLRPIRAGSGRIVARGTVTKPGRRIMFADATLEDASGTLLATASSSIAVLAPS